MTNAPKPNPTTKQRVLIASAEGVHRDGLRRALLGAGYQVDFCSSLQEVLGLLAEDQPAVFIHDWGAVDPSQSQSFQQRVSRLEEYSNVCRIIINKEITPQLVAVALETGVRRVLTYAAAALNIGEELKMALAADKGVAELQKKVRELHYWGAHYDQAEIDGLVEEAHKSFGHDPTVKLEYGNLCLRRSDLVSAKTIAAKILSGEPSNVRAMNLLARVEMKEGRFDDAVRILENANALSPKNPERLVALGEAFFKKGNSAASKKYYGEALEQSPGDPEAQKGLGQVLLSEGDASSALELFRNSASEEEAAGFFNNAAVQAVKAGKLDESLKLYDAALLALRSPRLKAVVYFNIGLAHRKNGEPQNALKAFNRCLKLEPGHERAQKQKEDLENTIVAGGK